MIEALYQDDVDYADALVDESGPQNTADVRALMVRVNQLARQAEQVEEIRDAVTERYDAKVDALARQAARLRAAIEAYLLNFNRGEKLAFPDVGTAFLRKTGGKPKVIDAEAFEKWLLSNIDDCTRVPYKLPVFDKTAALKLVQGEGGRYFIDTGRNAILDRDTGEVVQPDGVEVEPVGKALTLKAA